MQLGSTKKSIVYGLSGVAAGLLLTLFSSVVAAWQQYTVVSFSTLLLVQTTEALLWIIDASPLLLGLMSMLIGSQVDKLRLLQESGQQLFAEADRRNSDLALLVNQRTEKLEIDLYSAEQELIQKTKFLSVISHKFRTAMNGVVGMLGLLNETELSDLQQEYMMTANKSSAVLTEIVNDILDYTKIESGKLEFNKINFALHLLLDDIVNLYSGLAQNKGLKFDVDICDGLISSIHADSTRLRQILNIILANAIKFTQRGDVALKVSQQVLDNGKFELGFTISDTGIGIAHNQLTRLFEIQKRNTVINGSSVSESGLGLNIASQLVNMFGGEIKVDSTLTQGSVFHFTAIVDKVDRAYSKVSNESALQQRRILIISSNQTIVDSIDGVLSRFDSKLVHVRPDAWHKQLESNADGDWFDIVIFEQLSVAENYKDIIQKISDVRVNGQIQYLLLAAPGQRGDAQVAAEAGVNAYLTLPFSPEQLLDTLSRLLSQHDDTQLVTKHTLEEDDFQPNRVLVVEDNYANQLAAKAILMKLGMAVDVVDSGSDAISYSRQHQYKMVLMDCHMPNMDGFEAARQIRAMEKTKSVQPVPIVAMTVDVHPRDRQHCIESGMDDFIAKPVTVDLLDSTVKKWMKKAG